jgi:exosortase
MMTDQTREKLIWTAQAPLEVVLRWICVLGVLVLTVPGLLTLSRIWDRTEYLAHGYMIPPVAAFLFYRERKAILNAFHTGHPPTLGPILLFAAVSFEALALIGDVLVAAGIGIPLMLAATAYAIGGKDLLRLTRLPIGFLVLMVPPPGFLITRLLFDLKLLVTGISVGLLQATGFPVAAEGNQILIPHHTLFVANACSGLTSIVTLMPLAVVLAYFLSHGTWRRIVIIASIFPLAIGANVLRVLITVFLVSSRGIDFAQGLLHESFGITAFIFGTVCLVGIARILR